MRCSGGSPRAVQSFLPSRVMEALPAGISGSAEPAGLEESAGRRAGGQAGGWQALSLGHSTCLLSLFKLMRQSEGPSACFHRPLSILHGGSPMPTSTAASSRPKSRPALEVLIVSGTLKRTALFSLSDA